MRLTDSRQGILCKLASLLIALWLVVACSSSLSPTPEAGLSIGRTRDIIYATVDELRTALDVYAPSEPGPWPVVIVAHGAMQHRSDFADLSEAIASQGAVVYNIYVDFTVPFITGIERIGCAVRFARATAADYGGDPGRITLVGNSAGASTGAVVALAGDDFEGDCVVTEGSALLDALVAFEGPYDMAARAVGMGRFDHTYLIDEDPALLHAINPYSYIGRNRDLQTRLVHGDDVDVQWYDTPLEVSVEFHQALADAGYDVELIVVEGASHIALTKSDSDAFALTVQQVMELARRSSR
ncbi:MAG: carboxylesterase family protein [Anaerolineae bacterium]|nr:carboxylesterase family protein [Anaerolineae bacterium]NIN95908.1 carboxylesterase family protein [Anaerolineae bacterium]